MRTLEQISELILLRHYDGSIRPKDQKISIQEVQMHVLQARDYFLNQELSRNERMNDDLDAGWFTRYELHPILFSEGRNMPYLELPGGIVDTKYDKGLKISPMQGWENPFVPISRNFLSLRPELSRMEGNIPYQLAPAVKDGPRIVEFPTMRKGDWENVLLEVLERDQDSDPEGPLKMPGHYEDMVVRRVLEVLATKGPPGEQNDNKDQP